MTIFLLVLLVLLVGAVLAGIAGWFGGHMDEPTATTPYIGLPEGRLAVEDVESVRFDQTLRGYRMGQVDDVLDRLVAALGERDDEIARLRAEASAPRQRRD
ncbi:DivIVA domain-containing protein [Allobranchiibius huperziae]|uniref:DivIVA domain-containing protein n=1 Tax=Allobranchiibius huperziae TaxID=1874116 RepID=A0A853DHZ1_9MICO|nr:DivIVA domain-containing protein [Allobranchiibius huperziae]